MKQKISLGFIVIGLSYVPVLFRLTYEYYAWYIYAVKMLTDVSYISFSWLILSGFRQGVVRRLLPQSLHGKLHNYLGYGASIGIFVHPLFYAWRWNHWQLFIPFVHPYGRLISLGALALMILLITGLTSYFIRKRYYDLWNILHYLNYVFFILIFVHAWQSLPLQSPTGWYYIIVFALTVCGMLYKWAFDLRLLSFKTTVQSITLVAKDTFTVRFAVPEKYITTWEAGEYLMVTINSTDDQHPFSICRIYNDNTAEITFKIFGNFTKKFAQIKVGEMLYLTGPYGTANKMLQYNAKDLVLLAGGIGITPMRCMIYRLLERKDPRKIYLFYCVSDPNFFAFDTEFVALAKQYNHFKYIKICAKPCSDHQVIQGYISDTVIAKVVGDMTQYAYIVCGPDPMLAAVKTILHDRHVPRYQIHREKFSY